MVSADGNWQAGQDSRLSVWEPKSSLPLKESAARREMVGRSVGSPRAKRLLRTRQSAPLALNMLGSALLTRRSIWGVGCFTEPVQVKPAAVRVESSSLAAETRRDKRPSTFRGLRLR